MGTFGNGCTFVVNELGQKVDSDGFVTSSQTHITNRRTCVSVKIDGDTVYVRNSNDPDKKTLVFTAEEWRAFVAGVKKGEFEPS